MTPSPTLYILFILLCFYLLNWNLKGKRMSIYTEIFQREAVWQLEGNAEC